MLDKTFIDAYVPTYFLKLLVVGKIIIYLYRYFFARKFPTKSPDHSTRTHFILNRYRKTGNRMFVK